MMIEELMMESMHKQTGGDQDTLDFVAYVGKDDLHNRACFVLECEGGLAQDVIATIGQAFELRWLWPVLALHYLKMITTKNWILS